MGIPGRALWVWEEALSIKPIFHLSSIAISARLDPESTRFLCQGLRLNKTLDMLDLSGCYVRDDGCTSLANALGDNASLRELHVCNCGITNEGLEVLLNCFREENESVEVLHAEGNNAQVCGDSGNLLELYLDENDLNAKGVVKMANALKETKLNVLSVANNRMEDYLVTRLLSGMHDSRELRKVDVRGNKVYRRPYLRGVEVLTGTKPVRFPDKWY